VYLTENISGAIHNPMSFPLPCPPSHSSISPQPSFPPQPSRTTSLVTSSPRLSNDLCHLVDLSLRTAEGTELSDMLVWFEDLVAMVEIGRSDSLGRMVDRSGEGRTYSFLSELTCALVLAVAEEFDDAALVWCETGERMC